MSEEDSSQWRPLSPEQMSEDVRENFCSENFQASVHRQWIISQFESQTQSDFDPKNWTESELAQFRKWWWFQLENGTVFDRRRAKRETLLYQSLSGKHILLSQRHCEICHGGMAKELLFPISVLAIRIAPQSRQALSSIDWRAFQAAVADHFGQKVLDLGGSKHLCIAITFAVSKARRDKDLDNMTKSMIDAFARAIGFNDADIHHLDVVKLFDAKNEEFVSIRIAPSYLQDLSNVMVPVFDHGWAGQKQLNLEDYRK